MKRPARIPTVSISEDADSGQYLLMVSSYGETAPAGTASDRVPLKLRWKYRHDTREEAEESARKLREYLAGLEKER